MKLLYLECNMGAAGDMLMGALADLLDDREAFAERLNNVGIPGVRVEFQNSVKCGITGTHARVSVHGAEEESLEVPTVSPHTHAPEHGHTHGCQPEPDSSGSHPPKEIPDCSHGHSHSGHAHHGLPEIGELVDRLDLSDVIKKDIMGIYRILAEAEASVHGRPVTEVHFHEVGSLDALADITGCAMLIRELGADKIVTSPVNVGYGQVRCAHGILPVPAPAAARILEGIPCYCGKFEGELCTPTGAAVLKYFSDEYGRLPGMIIRKTGYGMGKKDFPAANCVRVFLGKD